MLKTIRFEQASMKLVERFFAIVFLIYCSNAMAQTDSIGYLIKTNPFAQFNGELAFGIEKYIKPTFTVEANWSVLKYYNQVSVLGNKFNIKEPNSGIIQATGISASLYLKKYINNKTWLAGAYWGSGILVLNDNIDYKSNTGLTGISIDKSLKAKNIGLKFKMGYQTRWTSNSYVDLSMISGYNLFENKNISQDFNFRYKKGLTGEFQIRLITTINAKDTNSNALSKKNIIKGSLWANPGALLRNGIYLGGMVKVLPNNNTYLTTEAYWYAKQYIFSNKYVLYGFQIGSRNYVNKAGRGGYAGAFVGYNNIFIVEELQKVSPGPSPINYTIHRNVIKEQYFLGMQYGYVISNSNLLFLDIGLQNGLRIGNKPFIRTNNVIFDFPNGTYTKLLIRMGAYIH